MTTSPEPPGKYRELLAFAAFALIAILGWALSYFIVFSCIDGITADGQHWGRCGAMYGEISGPVSFILPLLLGAVVAVALKR